MAEEKPARKNRRNLILIGAGVLIVICVGCLIITALFPSNTEEPTEVSQSQPTAVKATSAPANSAEATTPPEPTNPPEPTSTPLPSATPAPTATPEPTSTPNPDLVKPGTNLVGSDIQPGLYLGSAGDDLVGSCYWARLSDLSGELDALIANDNAIGHYYVEVLESDVALETACPLVLFHPEQANPEEFPTQIGPGDYLVGIDIQPGTYRGEAGEDIGDSCYWSRVSNFKGELDGILANDNAIGQYFVEVRESDYGLSTACELEWVQ